MRQALKVLAVTMALLVFAAGAATAKEDTAKKCRVQIKGIVGSVEVKPKNDDDWSAAVLDKCLKIGDKVKTGVDGKVALMYNEDEIEVRINSSSITAITAEDPDADEDSSNQLHLEKGQAWAKMSKSGSKFSVKTPTAVAGVRGTEFDVEVDEEGKSTVHVLEGVVGILNDLGEVLAEAGQMTEVLKDVIPNAPEAFDVDAFRSKLDEWKDKINIGKIIEAKKEEIKNKIEEKVKLPKKLKF